MKSKKIILGIILMVMMVMPVYADDFQISGTRLTKYTGSSKSVTIPNGVTTIGRNAFKDMNITSVTIPDSVTSIEHSAFENCKNLVNVNIGNGVTSIGDFVFENCANLTSVTIPDSVTSIGDYTFSQCAGLTAINVNSGNKNFISEQGVLFNKDKTKLIQYPQGKKDNTFTFPNSVTSIWYRAFWMCTSLTAINVNIGNSAYSSQDGVLYNKNKTTLIQCPAGKAGALTIPSSVTLIETQAFRGCAKLTGVTIPDSVTKINEMAFYGCTSLTSVTIPKNITSIERSAFYGCTSLTSVTIPNGVYRIEYWAFSSCTNLKSITIPNSVTSIGDNAFSSCTNLKSITIPNSVTSIGGNAFSDCANLTSVTFNGTIRFYSWNKSFDGDLSAKYLDGGIGTYTTTAPVKNSSVWTKLLQYDSEDDFFVNWDKNVEGGVVITSYFGLKNEVCIPPRIQDNPVTGIGYRAFSQEKDITRVIIPNNVTSIGDEAFLYCENLTGVNIPNSVTSISDSAFYGCTSLTAINVEASNTTYSSTDGILYNKNKTILFKYPAKKNQRSFSIPSSVTSIGDSAFEECRILTGITIPSNVTGIGNSAFSSCENLTGVTIPNSVKSIGSYAFYDCTRLNSVTIPNSVTSIGDSAFKRCFSLPAINVDAGNTAYSSQDGVLYNKNKTILINYPVGKTVVSFTIPNSVTVIEKDAFAYNSSLTSVNIPNSVIDIGDNAFFFCENLTNVIIPNGVTSIRYNTFCRTGLTSINIPNSVKIIEYDAFYGCNKLARITIPDSVTSIGRNSFFETAWLDNQKDGLVYAGKVAYKYKGTMPANTSITLLDGTKGIADDAFEDCTGLTGINIPNSVTGIGSDAFSGCTKLAGINIPDSVTSIGMNAFYDTAWYNNKPNGVVYAGKVAYKYKGKMPAFTNITLLDGTKGIADNAFSGCKNLTSVTIPNSVIIIGSDAFENCTILTGVTIGKGVTSIGRAAFYDCANLNSITIPNSITNIGYVAFYGCTNLTSVTFQGTITSNNFSSIRPFNGDLRAKYFTGGIGTYTTTAPVKDSSVWTKQQQSTAQTTQTTQPNNKLVIWSFTDELSDMTNDPTYGFKVTHPGIQVEYFQFPYDEFQDKLDPVLASGRGTPDIITLESSYVRKYVESGLLLDITDIYENNKSKLIAYPADVGAYKDKVYALSWQACPGAMYYRRSLAKKYLGTDDPKVIQTYFTDFNKFLETAQLLKQKSNGSCVVVSSLGDLRIPFLSARKDPWIVNGKLVIDPVMEKYMDICKTLHDKRWEGRVSIWSEGWFEGMKGGFKDELGKAVEVFSYFLPTWGLHYVLKTNAPNTSGDWAMIQGPSSYTWGGTWVGAYKGTKNVSAVKEFIRYITANDTFLEAWAKDTGDMISNINVINKIKDNYKEPYLGGQNHYAVFSEIAKNVNGKLFQATDEDIEGLFDEAVSDFINGEKSKAKALADFRKQVEAQF